MWGAGVFGLQEKYVYIVDWLGARGAEHIHRESVERAHQSWVICACGRWGELL